MITVLLLKRRIHSTSKTQLLVQTLLRRGRTMLLCINDCGTDVCKFVCGRVLQQLCVRHTCSTSSFTANWAEIKYLMYDDISPDTIFFRADKSKLIEGPSVTIVCLELSCFMLLFGSLPVIVLSRVVCALRYNT